MLGGSDGGSVVIFADGAESGPGSFMHVNAAAAPADIVDDKSAASTLALIA